MAITRDQFAILNFGYLTGLNLLQYAPEELLFQKYNQYKYLFQQGINQSIAEIKSRLATLYDLNPEFSNACQTLRSQQNIFNFSVVAKTYVNQIYIAYSPDQFPVSQVPGVIDVSSYVSVGTTAGGTDLLNNQQIDTDGFLWKFNKYYATPTTIYFTITGPAVDVSIAATIPPDGVTPAPAVSDQFIANLIKDDLLIKLVSILSIKHILASGAGISELMKAWFSEAETILQAIENKQQLLNQPMAKGPVSQVPYVVSSSFQTLG